MKIYTRTGDSGETMLFGGLRVSKDHPRVGACGALDELNAFLGRARASVRGEDSKGRLSVVQEDLFTLGAHLATPASGAEGEADGPSAHLPPLPDGRTQEMERWIDEAETDLPPLKEFILPGGSDGANELHLCRTVCRRSERQVVAVGTEDTVAAFTIRYLNRLSDLLFVLARLENRRAGVEDIPWRAEAR